MRGTTWGMDEDKHENHWRRTFCQIPFPAIYEHAENGKRSLHRLVEFFRRKAEAERAASDELRGMLMTPMDNATTANLDDLEEPGSSMRRALGEVKNYVDAACHQQLLLARVLEEQVAEPLVSLQEASEMYIRTLQGEIRNVNDEYMQALSAHTQAAARLKKASDELVEAKDRQRIALHGIGVPAFELQRLAGRVARGEDEVAQAELVKAQAKTHLYNRIIARDEMAMAVSVAYQKAEEERLDQLNSCLERFLHIEKERQKAAEKMLGSLEMHIKNVSRSEDIQLLIHNHRNPDNMHFQGKALALLDWHWGKMLAERERGHHHHDGDHHSVSTGADHRAELFGDPILIQSSRHDDGRVPNGIHADQKSPHGALAETPMGKALHELFAPDSEPSTPSKSKPPLARLVSDTSSYDDDTSQAEASAVHDEILDTAEELSQLTVDTSNSDNSFARECESTRTPCVTSSEMEEIVKASCQNHRGRALFVRCLNRQRSLETRVKDKESFDELVRCFNIFLDHCMRDDDVKAAKTAMILAETFYMAKKDAVADEDDVEPASRRERGGSWGFAHHPMGRGASRIYLQEEVKKHDIWKNPAFWEKALLLAIGEELHKTPQSCAWEDLPSGVSLRNRHHHSHSAENLANLSDSPGSDHHLYTREEAVSRVHNIVFGQLGSFTLSMLEFDVPFLQIESFVETMCDAHELTEDQRFLLRKNLQEVFATLKTHDD